MPLVQVIVVASLLLSVGFIASPVLLSASMQRQASSPSGFAESLIVSFLLTLICCWPWLRAYSIAHHPERRANVIGFSVVAAVCAALMIKPISNAPAEGIGYYVVLYVLGTWVVGALVLLRKAES